VADQEPLGVATVGDEADVVVPGLSATASYICSVRDLDPARANH
jgi:hypothetical protein